MYTVGSLADLISGNETPNKQAVLIKEVKYEKPIIKKTDENGKQKDKKGKKEKKSKIQETELETAMEETTDENIQNIKSKKKDKNSETPMEIALRPDSIIQNKKLNNAEKRKMLKRKTNEEETETDSPKKTKKTKLNADQTEDFEKDKDRTLFVGNVPLSTNEKDFKKFFSAYGEIENLRFRGIPPADMKTPKKVAFLKKEFHPKRKTMLAYICFKSADGAIRAAKDADGKKFNNFHLRVEYLNEKIKYDNKKTVFLGNLPFDAEEEDVRKVFEDCGKVLRVRLVRDKRSNMGKGFGYVNFETSDAVDLALQLGTVDVGKREVRIMRCNREDENKKQKDDGRKARERFAIYIFDIPQNTTEADLRDVFGKCGNILSTRIVNSDEIHCFINFEDADGVKNAINMQNPRIHGVPVIVKSKMRQTHERNPAIYIQNLPLGVTREKLYELFEGCGKIAFVRLFLKKTRATGVGFVNFETEEAVEKALEKKVKIGDSELIISKKSNKSKDEKPKQVKDLVEEELEEEKEMMEDLTAEKKWDDDVSSSSDEESDEEESPSVATKKSKLSADDDDDEAEVENENSVKEEDVESDVSDEEDVKKPKKKQKKIAPTEIIAGQTKKSKKSKKSK